MATRLERASEDLTAKARIRDAALRLFAEQGFEAATIRAIAAAAGVSSGLVRHHFGSKEALRDACDSFALERMIAIKEQAWVVGRLADPGFLASVYPSVLEYQRYVARSMVDGSSASAALFDQMVALTEQWAVAGRLPTTPADPRAFAAALVAMQSGLLMLHDHVSRALGADVLDAAGQIRLGNALVDLYSNPLLTAEQAAQARASYEQVRSRLVDGRADGDSGNDSGIGSDSDSDSGIEG
ncbi:TetR family transcriptional regulator [Frankia sp. CNm7]|uniref:TetR family transcriptional regulator n=1 Tax=Frankia nepalensis TaxID=1836974 RepID=A0A937UPJ3_9ACTN|nr:TetR family transcriptional regulator [Frankia nepalensis]MBL7497515.1 TetR family transcriptional regulator [Frankia nepalensis]MBL7510218.1 TetR family transcriptional regulator [Frankia nepalensis]MBL7523246.1 TetR family transcriptional regulator [Frankia nepalensis]MBL7630929.1 TetR family transcriptional regulator [Frankia nepalensis]